MVLLTELARRAGIGSRGLPWDITQALGLSFRDDVSRDWAGRFVVSEELAASVVERVAQAEAERRAAKQELQRLRDEAEREAERALEREAGRAAAEATEAARQAGSPHADLAGVVAAESVRLSRRRQAEREQTENESRRYWQRVGGW